MSFSVEIGFDCYDAAGRRSWVEIKIDGDLSSGDDPDVFITVEHNNSISLVKVVAIAKIPFTPAEQAPVVDRCMAIRVLEEYHNLKKVYDMALVMLA